MTGPETLLRLSKKIIGKEYSFIASPEFMSMQESEIKKYAKKDALKIIALRDFHKIPFNRGGVQLITPEIVFYFINGEFRDMQTEKTLVIFLKRNMKYIKTIILGVGHETGTIVDIKLLVQEAAKLRASNMILAHNHPSGNLKPSEADNTLTKNIKEIGKIIGTTLLDHLIICDNKYISII